MEDGSTAGTVGMFTHLPVLLAEFEFLIDQGFCRRHPDADNDPRLYNVELPIQPRTTGFELSRRRSAVDHTPVLRFHRPTLDDIGQPQLGPFETDLSQGLIKQPSSWPSKWPTSLLLNNPRSLTDEHHLR